MQGSRATTRHGFTRKRSSKRFKTYRTLNDSNDTNFESKFFSPFSTKKSFVDKDQDPDVNFYHDVSMFDVRCIVYILRLINLRILTGKKQRQIKLHA